PAFDTFRKVDQFPHLWIRRNGRGKFRHFFERRRNARLSTSNRRRYHFSYPFNIAVRHIQRTVDGLYRSPGGHRSERYDLANRISAVNLRDMTDNLATAANTEINIDIRHRNTFRIKESFEKKVVLDR